MQMAYFKTLQMAPTLQAEPFFRLIDFGAQHLLRESSTISVEHALHVAWIQLDTRTRKTSLTTTTT